MDDVNNPLQNGVPDDWDSLLQALGPASLLVAVQMRLGPVLSSRYQPQDILQEALMAAWRDRSKHTWSGVRQFRSWILTIIDNRIKDLADHTAAAKRGGGRSHETLALDAGSSGLIQSTTASRVASFREEARVVMEALHSLSSEESELIRLRLIEQMTIPDIARHLGLGLSATQHRFRKAAESYQARLQAASREYPRVDKLNSP